MRCSVGATQYSKPSTVAGPRSDWSILPPAFNFSFPQVRSFALNSSFSPSPNPALSTFVPSLAAASTSKGTVVLLTRFEVYLELSISLLLVIHHAVPKLHELELALRRLYNVNYVSIETQHYLRIEEQIQRQTQDSCIHSWRQF